MLDDVRKALRGTRSFRLVQESVGNGSSADRKRIEGAAASVLSFLAADLAEQSGRSILLITSRPDEAEYFADEIEGMIGEGFVHLFPSWELLPYENHSPAEDITAARVRAMHHLTQSEPGVVIATPRALAHRITPRRVFLESVQTIRTGDTFDLEEFCERLVHLGFEREPVADAPALFARRGGIVDLYPGERALPVRIEFFGDEVDSIREFNPETQRSTGKLHSVSILPQKEIPLTDEVVASVQDLPLVGEVADEITRGTHFEGMERYMGTYFPRAETLFDYLPDDCIVLALEERDILQSALEFWEEAEAFHAEAERGEQLPEPERSFLDARVWETALRETRAIPVSRVLKESSENVVPIRTSLPAPVLGNLELLNSEIDALLAKEYRIFFLCDNEGQLERMTEILDPYLDRVAVGLGRLRRGFALPDERIAVFAEHEVFSRMQRRRGEVQRPRGTAIESYLTLRPGDYVVHVRHGIGQFVEVQRIEVEGVAKDCVVLSYSSSDKLYVPNDQMDLLQKYSGSEGKKPPIDKIGGTTWGKTTAKAKKAVKDMAAELLRIYAARKSRPGIRYSPDTEWQRELEEAFLHDETEHQLEAIRAVKADMESPRPMDRLVCGDVGFGKTEVAVRGAFKAVMEGKQVAVLVPTTLLAQQHYQTFSDRYRGFPVRVEVLSRFRSRPEVKQVLEDLSFGRVDVLIGTHRILSKDIKFKELGLLIIDEEQRFGVAQKEKLKKLKMTVDVLTLTATPIPRTLHLSIAGARDMSMISTPPKNRLPIATEVIDFDNEVITAAILREMDRGGQIFFVHNKVESIDAMALRIAQMVPEARIGVAHGQMTGTLLEKIMLDFVERRIDVLVSTMIVESGLDIPSVNTLIVNQADHMGLAQLYQLRGRVGRSSHRAYTYLIVDHGKVLTEESRKRLDALTDFTELGSGIRIARKDLEIRGAGNLLGSQQHGFVASVGFEMYCKLLEEAVRELRGETVEKSVETRIEAHLDSYLSDEYIGDKQLKVAIYRRVAETKSADEVRGIRDEVTDRFGRLEEAGENLFALRELKILGEGAEAESVRLEPRRVRVRTTARTAPPEKVWKGLMEAVDGDISFEAADGLSFDVLLNDGAEPIDTARKVLVAFQGSC